MKKIRLLALTLLISLTLTACDVEIVIPGLVPQPDTNSGNSSSNETPSDENGAPSEDEIPEDYNNEDITFDIGEQVMIVIADADNTLAYAAQQMITGITNKWAITVTDDYKESANELTFGRCDRDVSRDAYEYLESYELENKHSARFGFYSYGNSVAIAYDEIKEYEAYIVDCAIKCFKEKYVKEGEPLNIEAGTLYIETVDLAAYQAELDEKRKEEVWSKFAATAGEEAAEALAEMYDTLYSDGLIEWFANLYDVDMGGYYYSNSARDDYRVKYGSSYYDLLPDIESTAQALGFITSSGMTYGLGGLSDALPDWMKTSIIKFMKERQDPGGYFYHPQWTKAMVDSQLSRRGRDLGNAVSILKQLGAKPTYSTPIGDTGDGLLWDGTSIAEAQSALTLPIKTSAAVAVSRVVSASSVTVPDHLVDDVAFKNYLYVEIGDQINTNSYWVGNQLASQANQIVARDIVLKDKGADYSLVDILVEWLDDHCYESTGHWSTEANYAGLNGLMKISSAYETLGRPLPYPEAAVQSAIATIDTAETNSTVCYCYNSWFAIKNIINNVSRHKPMDEAEEIIGNIRTKLCERAPELIRATAAKQGKFMCEDGSFSYTVASSSSTSQGMPVATPGTKEGDVNATVICTTGTLGQMFSALGYTMVPIFYRSDLNTYLDIIEENKEKRDAQYNYAESEADIDPKLINYKITTHTNSETGVTAPVIKIYNSVQYTDAETQKKILRHIFNTDEGRAARLSEADIEYYINEWNVHNYMYNNPSLVAAMLGMTTEEVKERAKHVDLNTNDERRDVYESLGKSLGS